MVNKYSLRKDGNKQLSKNFKVSEFRCKDGSDEVLVDDALVNILQKVRDHFNKPITINSSYRTKAHNAKVKGSRASQHCKGTAADIVVQGIQPLAVALYANTLPELRRGGLGLYHRPDIMGGFVHIDTRTNKKSQWLSKSGTTYLSVSNVMPTLKKGSKDITNSNSYAVTVLQRELGIKVDGNFGDITENALKAFQAKNKLVADGICGEKTWLALSKQR